MDDNDLVEVLDLTFYVAQPGQNGEPARLRYTVREHVGDVVTEGESVLGIRFADRDINGRKVRGKAVTIATNRLIAMERDVRLEPRVRRSAASYLDPDKAAVDALKAKHLNPVTPITLEGKS